MVARVDVVDTKVLCTDHTVSKTALCRLVALIIGAIPEDHLEVMVSDVMDMMESGEERSLLVLVGCAFATPPWHEAREYLDSLSL